MVFENEAIKSWVRRSPDITATDCHALMEDYVVPNFALAMNDDVAGMTQATGTTSF